MTTIANLVVAASLSPDGVRRGLDEMLGYTQRFARQADAVFATIGPNNNMVQRSKDVVNRIEAEFKRLAIELKEDFTTGVIDPQEYATRANQAGRAMNQALLSSLEEFRARGIFDPRVEAEFMAKVKADVEDVAMKSRSTPTLFDALNKSSHSGALGVGLIRRELTGLAASLTGTNPLVDRLAQSFLTMGAGGAVSIAVVAGIVAIAGAWALLTREARAAEKAQDEALKKLVEFEKHRGMAPGQERTEAIAQSGPALARHEDALVLATGIESSNNMIGRLIGEGYKAWKGITAKGVAEERFEFAKGQRALNADVTKDFVEQEGKRAQELEALVRHSDAKLSIQRQDIDRARQMQREAQALYDQYSKRPNTPENDQIRAGLKGIVENIDSALTKQPKAAAAPYPELKRQIDALTQSYSALRAEGISPTVQMQSQMEAMLRRLDLMLYGIPDKASAAAKAIGGMMKELISSGMHANDELLNPMGSMDDFVAHLAERNTNKAKPSADIQEQISYVKLLEKAYGEMDERTITAEAQLRAMQDSVNNALRDRTLLTRDQETQLLQSAAAITDAFKEIGQAQAKSLWPPEEEERMQIAIRQFKELTGQVRNSRHDLTGLTRGFSEIAQAVREFGAGAKLVADALQGVGRFVGSIANFQQTNAQVQSARDRQAAEDAAAKREGRDSTNVGGQLAGVLGQFAQFTAAIGVIGTGFNMVRSLVSAFETHDAVLEANTTRLKELRLAMVSTGGVGGQLQALQAIKQAQSLGFDQQSTFRGSTPGEMERSLAALLTSVGLTRDQFDKMAHDLGITESALSMKWLDAFGTALEMATVAATKYTQSLQDQTSLMELHNKVFGLTKPEDSITSTIALLDKFAPKLAASLEGFNTATDAGREQLRAALKNLVTLIESGGITSEMLGSLTGVKDLAGIIMSVSDSLDELKKTTDSVTQSVTNVPSWYKIAAARVFATDPRAPTTSHMTPLTPPAPLPPGGPGLSRSGDTNLYGNVYVDAKALTADQMARAVLRVLQGKSQTQFGTSTDWSQVQSV